MGETVAPVDERSALERFLDRGPRRRRWAAAWCVTAAAALAVLAGLDPDRPARRPADVDDVVAFAVFIAVAAAVERAVEITAAPWVGGSRDERVRLLGGFATLVSVVAAWALGLRLLAVLSDGAGSGTEPADALVRAGDLLVTGLALGGGAKPVHDLLRRIERTKRAARERLAVERESGSLVPGGGPDPGTGTAPQVRVVVPGPAGPVRTAVEAVRPAGRRWFVQEGPHRTVVIAPSPWKAGTRPHTAETLRIAYRLRALGLDAHPDLPATGAAVAGVRVIGTGAAPDPRWALRAVGLDAAFYDPATAPAHRWGDGVRVGHPDSGWTAHPLAPAWDLDGAVDLVEPGGDARDDLRGRSARWDLAIEPAAGHGTATAGVIAGRGGVPRPPVPGWWDDAPHVGVAPRATVVPARVGGPVFVFGSVLDDAVRHLAALDTDGEPTPVISMSLGGQWLPGLHDSIREAVRRGVIVVAAAGNQVGFVVSPAAWREVIAVTGSGPDDAPFVEMASRGPAVEIAAPAHRVWRPGWRDDHPVVEPSDGTSYAVAHVAGAAALWSAAHAGTLAGWDPALRVGAFRLCLTRTARRPPGWPGTDWGAGILDVPALLAEPLPSPAEAAGALAGPTDDDSLPHRLVDLLSFRLGRLWDRIRDRGLAGGPVEAELRWIVSSPPVQAALAEPDAAPETVIGTLAGPQLRTAIRGRIPPELRDRPPPAARRRLDDVSTVGAAVRWVTLALVAVAGLAAGAGAVLDQAPLVVTAGTVTTLAAFIVAAQATERLCELAVAPLVLDDQPDRRAERALLMTAAAVVVGVVLAGAVGLRIVGILSVGGPGDLTAGAADLAVTGLALAGGAAPLHDLLRRVQTAAEAG